MEHFGENFYVIGDCAFENTKHMVTLFKKLALETLPDDKEGFNTYMGRLHFTSEHTIGMLKGHFQFLMSIPMIDNGSTSLRRILRYCALLIVVLYSTIYYWRLGKIQSCRSGMTEMISYQMTRAMWRMLMLASM
jgi:DDE superfamily endonuclease